MKHHDNTDRLLSAEEVRELKRLLQEYEENGSSLYIDNSLSEIRKVAADIRNVREQLLRLRRRIRSTLTELSDGEEELYLIAFGAIDQLLAQARDRLAKREFHEAHRYIETAGDLIRQAHNKLER